MTERAWVATILVTLALLTGLLLWGSPPVN